jgi:disulfide bond formation protein DsbB
MNIKILKKYGLYLSWLIALVSTLGSIFFSDVLNYVPCNLCWYQRIFMFPLSILLGIAAYKNEKSIISYVRPLLLIGMVVAFYQFISEVFPSVALEVFCGEGKECVEGKVVVLGFISLAFLGFMSFLSIFCFLDLVLDFFFLKQVGRFFLILFFKLRHILHKYITLKN